MQSLTVGTGAQNTYAQSPKGPVAARQRALRRDEALMAVKVETAVILLARPKLMELFFSSSSVVVSELLVRVPYAAGSEIRTQQLPARTERQQ